MESINRGRKTGRGKVDFDASRKNERIERDRKPSAQLLSTLDNDQKTALLFVSVSHSLAPKTDAK